MNKWKISFFLCVAALIVTNLFWLYQIVDSGVTLTYQQVTIDEQAKIIESLGELVVKGAKDYSQKDILYLLRKSNPRAFIVEDQNKITFEGAQFIFDNGKLIKVSRYQ